MLLTLSMSVSESSTSDVVFVYIYVLFRHNTTNENYVKQLSIKSPFRAAIAIADCRHIVCLVLFIGPSFIALRADVFFVVVALLPGVAAT